MAFEIRTEIEIEAKKERVWSILMDFANYKEWNPFIRKIEGNPEVGKKIYAEIDGMKFKPRVLEKKKEKEFRWIGKLFFKGLFDGEHCFRIEDLGNGRIKFIQSERFKGILLPLLKKKLKTDTVIGFKEMNQSLKERAENRFF